MRESTINSHLTPQQQLAAVVVTERKEGLEWLWISTELLALQLSLCDLLYRWNTIYVCDGSYSGKVARVEEWEGKEEERKEGVFKNSRKIRHLL